MRRCCGTARHRASDYALGPLDALTVEDARVGTRALLADAAAGDRRALTAPKVGSLARTFLADCAERWQAATRKTYAFNVQRWIEPALVSRRLDAIGTKDVRSWFEGIAVTHRASASWALAAMSSSRPPSPPFPPQPVLALADHGVRLSAAPRW